MRVAFFGGTFDPIHNGHLAVATAAADTFALDQILFAPAGRQPLKPDHPTAPYSDRLAMTTLACAASNNPRFLPSTLDAPRPDATPNYTIDTLTTLRRQLPTATLFVLVGADTFLDLRRWRQPNRLLELAEWIVVSRPGYPLETLKDRTDRTPLNLTPAQQARVHLLPLHEDVSATTLRHRLHQGDPCTDLLPPAVSTYIHDHHLYR